MRLPVEQVLPELLDALNRHRTAVLVSPPGTGKTTLVPLALRGRGKIIVAEPRRVAARAAARRMARLLGDDERVGRTVGYTVRGDRKVGSHTEIEVVTTGVLVQRLLRDPDLPGVGAVVLDECHERHLDTDLALAFLVDVRATIRPDLRLLATSATADAQRLARILDAKVIEAPTVLYPVEEVWMPPARPFAPPQGTTVDPRLLDHVAATIRGIDANVLAFLPGVGEINAVRKRLGDNVATLHGRMPAAEQDAILTHGARVVLATSVAESSLTVPGVRAVVDAGLAREPRTDHARGLGRLVTVRESKATATQRAGRAGREAPGTVYRLWSPADHERLPDHAQPEIAIADLTGFALALANWGHPDGTGLALPDRPPSAALDVARATLQAIDAVDDSGRITERGRQMAAIGTHPRLARALLDGGDQAAEVVALLEDETLPLTSDDLEIALKTITSKEWRAEVRRLRTTSTTRKGTGEIVGLAYPERIARRRREGTYLMAGGTAAELTKGSALHGAEWLAIAIADRPVGHAQARIRLAAAIDEETARKTVKASTVEESGWVDGKLIGRRIERLGAITLKETPLADPPFTVDGLKLEWLNWTPKALLTRQRLAFLHATYGPPWPDVSDDALLERAEEWIDGKDVNLRRLVNNKKLDELAPERIGGKRVNYEDPTTPTIAVKVQDAFGWTEAPKIGHITVLVHLLSPAGRPVAVTRDLESFWRTGYPQVRAELRGRYPKHSWPSQPGADRPA